MRTFVLTDDEMYMKLCAVADCADPKAILECQNVETFKEKCKDGNYRKTKKSFVARVTSI